MKKRVLTFLLTGVLLTGTLAGCQTKKAENSGSTSGQEAKTDGTTSEAAKPSDKAVQLKAWFPPFGTEDSLDLQVWEDILTPYKEEHNVAVDVDIISWDNYDEKYMTGLSSGTGPDIGYMYFEQVADYIDMGAILPMDEYITDADRDNYLHLNKGIIDSKQYMFPFIVGNARILVGNMDVLNDVGVTDMPTTWDEFIEVCLKVKEQKPDVMPFVQGWNDASIGVLNSSFYPYLWQAGGSIYSEDGTEPTFNSPEGIRAAQFIYDLRFKHGVIPDTVTSLTGEEGHEYLNEGKAAFMVMGTRDTIKLKDINWDFVISLQDKQKGTFIAVDSLVLISTTKYKQESMDVIKFITSKGSMEKYHTFTPFSPLTKDAVYLDDERFKEIYTTEADSLHVLPTVKGSHRVFDFLAKNMQIMMLGEKTPEETLNEAADYAKAAVN